MIGCDIVDIKRFSSVIDKEGEAFLCRVFTTTELQDQRLEHLAGIYAAKEAIMKTGLVPVGAWQEVEIFNDQTGKPQARFSNANSLCDISISHDGDYVIAIAWRH